MLLFIFCIALNFNPQGPRGPRPNPIETSCSQSSISIHKALAGLDYDLPLVFLKDWISIHKALAGLDMAMAGWKTDDMLFQSTRPSRASTISSYTLVGLTLNFNPQGPRGPRPYCVIIRCWGPYFNPQGPRGPRQWRMKCLEEIAEFQSTRPSRASTT